MNFYGALRSYLLSDGAVAALVGVRVYSQQAPQNAVAPYIVINFVSSVPMNNLNEFTGIVTERWQIDAYGLTSASADAVSEAIFDRLHFKQYLNLSGFKCLLAQKVFENVSSEPADDGSEKVFFRRQQDFSIKRELKATA